MATIIQSRNDTATNWATVNPVLAQGEIGIELDTRKFKVGDGINDWNNLPYFVSGGGSVESVNGQTGVVILDAEDVGALPDSTVIPTKVSDLTNDSGFITNTVNNLTNYYLKTETYTQSEVNQLIANIPKFSVEVVQALPATGEAMVLYLVPKTGTAPDVYEEYVWVEDDSTFELLGSTAVDLTGYIQNTDYAGFGHISNKSATNKYLSPSTIDDVASVSARSVYDKSATISNGTINLDEGCVFYTHSPSTNTTYTINTSALTQSGFPCRYFNVVITMPSVAVTCDFTTNNNVTWTENRTPDMSTGSRTYLLAFQTFDGGTNWVGSLCTWWE